MANNSIRLQDTTICSADSAWLKCLTTCRLRLFKLRFHHRRTRPALAAIFPGGFDESLADFVS